MYLEECEEMNETHEQPGVPMDTGRFPICNPRKKALQDAEILHFKEVVGL